MSMFNAKCIKYSDFFDFLTEVFYFLLPKVWNKLKFGKPTDEAKLVKDYEFLDEVLGHLEKIFLGDDAFLFGGEISIADICVMSEVRNLQ